MKWNKYQWCSRIFLWASASQVPVERACCKEQLLRQQSQSSWRAPCWEDFFLFFNCVVFSSVKPADYRVSFAKLTITYLISACCTVQSMFNLRTTVIRRICNLYRQIYVGDNLTDPIFVSVSQTLGIGVLKWLRSWVGLKTDLRLHSFCMQCVQQLL